MTPPLAVVENLVSTVTSVPTVEPPAAAAAAVGQQQQTATVICKYYCHRALKAVPLGPRLDSLRQPWEAWCVYKRLR